MTEPVYFVELNSPNHSASAEFFRAVFGWDPQPFAAPEYLVAPHGEASGVDSAISLRGTDNRGVSLSFASRILTRR
ncbi:VOC family protein [Arthrobacter sp. RHLT1-20]